MAKCRGCGGDTREFRGGPGWMHYECEIKRLNGLLEESDGMLNDIEKNIPCSIIDLANGNVNLVVADLKPGPVAPG